jgi:hypothetical protein
MDNAVALVQAYLRVNGYFTVAEYPVIEAMRRGSYQMATDIDILALRFPGSRRMIRGPRRSEAGGERMVPDPVLGAPPDRVDMLIGEVKEGHATLNRGALSRFGCCEPEQSLALAGELLSKGRSLSASGHVARIVLFGTAIHEGEDTRYERIDLGHVLDFLLSYLRSNWEVLRHAQFKDPCLSLLITLEKARAGEG